MTGKCSQNIQQIDLTVLKVFIQLSIKSLSHQIVSTGKGFFGFYLLIILQRTGQENRSEVIGTIPSPPD